MDPITRTGSGTRLYVTSLSPERELDVAADGITWGDNPHPVMDKTRLKDTVRKYEAAGVPDTPTVEVMVFDNGMEILPHGSTHTFRLVQAPARGETKGPERSFTAVVVNDSGPRFSLDANPLLRTLSLKVSGDVAYVPGSTEVLP